MISWADDTIAPGPAEPPLQDTATMRAYAETTYAAALRFAMRGIEDRDERLRIRAEAHDDPAIACLHGMTHGYYRGVTDAEARRDALQDARLARAQRERDILACLCTVLSVLLGIAIARLLGGL